VHSKKAYNLWSLIYYPFKVLDVSYNVLLLHNCKLSILHYYMDIIVYSSSYMHISVPFNRKLKCFVLKSSHAVAMQELREGCTHTSLTICTILCACTGKHTARYIYVYHAWVHNYESLKIKGYTVLAIYSTCR